MGTVGRFGMASMGVLAALAAGSAQALEKHVSTATASPYSFGLAADRVPAVPTCPATSLYCARGEGLNLSLVGRARVASSFGVFGKLGTLATHADTSVMGASPAPLADTGLGLSWGGGVSWNVTPRLAATVEWNAYELRAPGGGATHATSLGLKYRY